MNRSISEKDQAWIKLGTLPGISLGYRDIRFFLQVIIAAEESMPSIIDPETLYVDDLYNLYFHT
jgi:hypothetical protein